jgi:capsular polysaccharide biosynthesis protein
MKIENIKLIHTLIDVPITCINGEKNFENVFILNANNNNINGITYSCPLSFDSGIIKKTLDNAIVRNVENVCLFYSFMYQIAFGHFTEQCLPKIKFYLRLKEAIKGLKLCIPKKRYNLITNDIMRMLNICEDDIIILDHDTVICAENLYYNNYECADFNADKIETFNLIREKLLLSANTKFNRNVYIKRNTENIVNNDCYNIGKTRQIVNEDQLISALQKLNFEIITLGERDIYEKKNLLSNINILITQTGGTMYNLIFANTPKSVIFLSNNSPLHVDYIRDLLPRLNFYTSGSVTTFKYGSYIYKCDITNVMNDPFIVNIDQVINYCKNKV